MPGQNQKSRKIPSEVGGLSSHGWTCWLSAWSPPPSVERSSVSSVNYIAQAPWSPGFGLASAWGSQQGQIRGLEGGKHQAVPPHLALSGAGSLTVIFCTCAATGQTPSTVPVPPDHPSQTWGAWKLPAVTSAWDQRLGSFNIIVTSSHIAFPL